ncbi:MAG: S9 family peptidase [Bacteroidales bacterium]|nr:S9 family peptidase [Bacteroidales bacterium]
MKTQLTFLTLLLIVMNVPMLHAQEAEDPYLWLEDIEGEKSLEWVRTQNELSEKVFTEAPLFNSLNKALLEVYDDEENIAYPDLIGKHVYNFWQDAEHERGVWRRMLKENYLANDTIWEIVLDLDALSAKENKKWVFGGANWLEPDYRICLLSLSDGGTDKSELREFDVTKKEFVENGFYLKESKGSAGWIDENTLLFTSDFGEGSLSYAGYPRIAKVWKRGTPAEDAKTILEVEPEVAGLFGGSYYSEEKLHTIVFKMITTFESEIYYYSDRKLKKLDFPADAEFRGSYKSELLLILQSDWEVENSIFPAGALVSLNLEDNLQGKNTVKLIHHPNSESSITSLLSSKDYIVVNILENVRNKLIKYSLKDGRWKEEEVKGLPGFGGIDLITFDKSSNDYFFQFSNFITPPTLYYANDHQVDIARKLKDYFDPSDLTVEQHWATSKDGTKIPYFIVFRKDIELNGSNPTLVDAYGGFNISSQPFYSATIGLGWLEQGGVYVLANIRGGGEFGPAWHQAAVREKRQNAYDDFYAVAENLIAQKITSPGHLGIYGWSNGGLLTGVAFTQRPDLYHAAIVGAPLLDMRRYSKMLAGASWMAEYGDPDKPEDWAYLKKFSPYHNLKKEAEYPKVLFVTSIKDDRVHPGHARKMAAKMADMGHPFYYYETIEGGHGAASTNEQSAKMNALIYTYLNEMLK